MNPLLIIRIIRKDGALSMDYTIENALKLKQFYIKYAKRIEALQKRVFQIFVHDKVEPGMVLCLYIKAFAYLYWRIFDGMDENVSFNKFAGCTLLSKSTITELLRKYKKSKKGVLLNMLKKLYTFCGVADFTSELSNFAENALHDGKYFSLSVDNQFYCSDDEFVGAWNDFIETFHDLYDGLEVTDEQNEEIIDNMVAFLFFNSSHAGIYRVIEYLFQNREISFSETIDGREVYCSDELSSLELIAGICDVLQSKNAIEDIGYEAIFDFLYVFDNMKIVSDDAKKALVMKNPACLLTYWTDTHEYVPEVVNYCVFVSEALGKLRTLHQEKIPAKYREMFDWFMATWEQTTIYPFHIIENDDMVIPICADDGYYMVNGYLQSFNAYEDDSSLCGFDFTNYDFGGLSLIYIADILYDLIKTELEG